MDSIIFIPLLAAFGFLYWASQLEDEDYAVLKLLFQFLFIPLIWLSIHFAIIDASINYASEPALVELLADVVYYLGWIVFIIGVYYAFIIFKNVRDIILTKRQERKDAKYES
jgi:hypothetical protein